jgi:hypothetical protein
VVEQKWNNGGYMKTCVYALAIMLSGCYLMYMPTYKAFQDASSGFTGCLPTDNVVSDITMDDGHRTWKVECNGGAEYRCMSAIYFQLIKDPHCVVAQ